MLGLSYTVFLQSKGLIPKNGKHDTLIIKHPEVGDVDLGLLLQEFADMTRGESTKLLEEVEDAFRFRTLPDKKTEYVMGKVKDFNQLERKLNEKIKP